MPNRLARETSPYLLQHAHNPVDWWPWCDEAFEHARARNLPVFLSIGYSTCYWCHVMERESFEDARTAALLHQHFVPIKVDREERPDVDEVYMAATVLMTGHGGWPMSVFLEPHKRRPFWCGTYFPLHARPNMPTFTQVLDAIARTWREQRSDIDTQAEQLAAAVRESVSAAPPTAQLGQHQVADSVAALLKIFDRSQGGFGSAPKFPQPVFLEFLLDARARAADDSTADAIDLALRKTLDKMACGGLFDQVGGGFHRYSVDGMWTVPHFEKMLYDNAQLARTYARAARHFGDPFYEIIARRTLAYITREMTGTHGAFSSAQDAEVDGREGLNYLWLPQEVRDALDDTEDAELAIRLYGLSNGPNFQDPHHPGEPARNVLRLEDRPDRVAPRFNLSPAALEERLDTINQTLYSVRAARKQPRLDDKVITAWNGLMIGAFAAAARELSDDSLLIPARRAAAFILSHLTDSDGEGGERRLLRTFRDNQAKTPGFLDDHAFLIHGLLELARASSGHDRDLHLQQAAAILNLAQSSFLDENTGAWHDTRDDDTEIFVRARTTHDGATPSASSVMLHNLLDLAELTGDPSYSDLALKSLIAVSGSVAQTPVGAINSTRALLRFLLAAPPDAAARLQETPSPLLAANAPQANPNSQLPVEVFASTDRVSIPTDAPASLTLFVQIAEGYHVPAADPGVPSLIPFRVSIVNGTGIAAYAGYPEGTAHADHPRSYTGGFELPIALERTGEWSGRPLLAIMFQACTDTECLAPTMVELDIALDRA